MTYYKVYFDKEKKEFIQKEYYICEEAYKKRPRFILTDKKTGITQQIDKLDVCRVFPGLLIGVGTNIDNIMDELNKIRMAQMSQIFEYRI